jgi:hypothetical protein
MIMIMIGLMTDNVYNNNVDNFTMAPSRQREYGQQTGCLLCQGALPTVLLVLSSPRRWSRCEVSVSHLLMYSCICTYIYICTYVYYYIHLYISCISMLNLILLVLQYSHNEGRSWMTSRTSTTPSQPPGSATCSRNCSLWVHFCISCLCISYLCIIFPYDLLEPCHVRSFDNDGVQRMILIVGIYLYHCTLFILFQIIVIISTTIHDSQQPSISTVITLDCSFKSSIHWIGHQWL